MSAEGFEPPGFSGCPRMGIFPAFVAGPSLVRAKRLSEARHRARETKRRLGFGTRDGQGNGKVSR